MTDNASPLVRLRDKKINKKMDPHGVRATQITLNPDGNRAAHGKRKRKQRGEKRSEEPKGTEERRAGTERAGMTNWASNGVRSKRMESMEAD